MKIAYDVTGAERKKLVTAVSQETGNEAKYQGAPTFAYQIGEYAIDKNGTLTGPDNHDLIADLNGLHDFRADEEIYDTPLPEMPEVDENIEIPWEAELGGRVSPYRDHEEPPAYGIPESTPESECDSVTADTLTPVIEMPRDGFTDEGLANLEKLIASKAELIKRALGAEDLTVQRTEGTLRFAWFPPGASADEVKAYSEFISAICKMAKEQKRITATPKEVDNEKYAFRCFLLRLGFIGEDFKASRKILLARLTGNGSFRSGERQLLDESAPEQSEEDNTTATDVHSENGGGESEAAQ